MITLHANLCSLNTNVVLTWCLCRACLNFTLSTSTRRVQWWYAFGCPNFDAVPEICCPKVKDALKKWFKIEKLQSTVNITHICPMKIWAENKCCRWSDERTSYVQTATMDKICWFKNGSIWNQWSWLLTSEVVTHTHTHTHTHTQSLYWPSCGGYYMYAYVFFIQYCFIILVTSEVLYIQFGSKGQLALSDNPLLQLIGS